MSRTSCICFLLLLIAMGQGLTFVALADSVFTQDSSCTLSPSRPIVINGAEADELRQVYSLPSACWPEPELDEGVKHRELGLLLEPEFPPHNPLTRAKLELGEKLFHDPKLSRSRQIACASCHDKDLGWGDGRRVSFGHDRRTGKRNAPSIENSAFYTSFFWDGRADSLEEQALMPIVDPNEMNFTLLELEQRLALDSEYPAMFKRAFGRERITAKDLAKAIATYERSITSRLSRFDSFLIASQNGREKKVLKQIFPDDALRGLHLFRTKARCLNCHNGPEMSDSQFHNIGLTYYGRFYEDLGQFEQTYHYDDVGKFRTPGLRGVMNTKPWMHNGLFVNMRGLINYYNVGGVQLKKLSTDLRSPETSHLMKPLQLTESEIEDLMAFLEAISPYPASGPSHQVIEQLDE